MNGGTSHCNAARKKASVFEKSTKKRSSFFFMRCFASNLRMDSMKTLNSVSYRKNKSSKCHSYAKYATDCRFEKGDRPFELNFKGGKDYFREKQKDFSFKTEVSVLPIGLFMYSSNHKPSSAVDITTVSDDLKRHKIELIKNGDDEIEQNDGELVNVHDSQKAILMENGYQSLARDIRAITPTEKKEWVFSDS